jgi:hypothetical protein
MIDTFKSATPKKERGTSKSADEKPVGVDDEGMYSEQQRF